MWLTLNTQVNAALYELSNLASFFLQKSIFCCIHVAQNITVMRCSYMYTYKAAPTLASIKYVVFLFIIFCYITGCVQKQTH